MSCQFHGAGICNHDECWEPTDDELDSLNVDAPDDSCNCPDCAIGEGCGGLGEWFGPVDRRYENHLLASFATTCEAERNRQARIKLARRLADGVMRSIRRCNVCQRALVWSQLRNPRVWDFGDPSIPNREIAECCGCGNTLSREASGRAVAA